MPEKPAKPDTRPNGLEIDAPLYSINDKMLGAGEPIRVKQGQRVLMHLLNSSASQIFAWRCRATSFSDRARRQSRAHAEVGRVVQLGPGERVDAIVEMNQPGIWILGALRDLARNAGMGIVSRIR